MPDQLPVSLTVMTAGDIRMECARSIVECVDARTISQVNFIPSGPYLDNGRNNIVRAFNAPEVRERCTHLLMVDSDVSFTPDDVRAVYDEAHEHAVVGGVYYSAYDGRPKPVVYDWAKVEWDGQMLDTLEVINEWSDGWPFWPKLRPKKGVKKSELSPLVKVPAMGAGFLMIRYEVIDVLYELHGEPQPWFHEPVIDGIHFGEDLAFCLRVADAGFSVWAHRGVEVTHYKTIALGPQADTIRA